ncbi:unnamed protein product, partial [Discosporangium mesarthrocarpum]
NLDFARNIVKEPGLAPIRIIPRVDKGQSLSLGHMALGDRYVTALVGSLDNLEELRSMDLSDNRIGGSTTRLVISKAEEHGVEHLDLSWNAVDTEAAG